MASKRAYTSPLREQRTEETRQRILDAAARVLSAGAAALTVPEVAREAGVAVPTVYRHFASKEALEDALADSVRAAAGVGRPPPRDLAALVSTVRTVWTGLDDLPRAHLAALMASVGRELLDETSPEQRALRAGFMRRAIADELPGVPDDDVDRVATIASALASSPGFAAFLRLGLDADHATDLYAEILDALIAAARSRAISGPRTR